MISVLMLWAALQDPAPLRLEDIHGASASGLAAGHTGKVTLQLTLATDGSLGDVTVVNSSRSELLDAEAVALLTRARGAPRSDVQTALVDVYFYPRNIPTMSCGEFVRQIRWYEGAWPEQTYQDANVFMMSVGVMNLALVQQARGMQDLVIRKRRLDAAFQTTLAECEAEPGRGYMATLRENVGDE